MSHEDGDLRRVIRLRIVVAFNRHEKVMGSSYRCLINFLEPKMQNLPWRDRQLRIEIGAVIQQMQDEGELEMRRGQWRMSGQPDDKRRPNNRRRNPRGSRYRNDRSYHGRPKRDRRCNRVPASTTWAP